MVVFTTTHTTGVDPNINDHEPLGNLDHHQHQRQQEHEVVAERIDPDNVHGSASASTSTTTSTTASEAGDNEKPQQQQQGGDDDGEVAEEITPRRATELYMKRVVDVMDREDWEELSLILTRPELRPLNVHILLDHWWAILHICCVYGTLRFSSRSDHRLSPVPLHIFQSILQAAKACDPQAAFDDHGQLVRIPQQQQQQQQGDDAQQQQQQQQDPNIAAWVDPDSLRTPLHMILMEDIGGRPVVPDLVRLFVQEAPHTIHVRDMEGLRPIDILTQKILMKEEHLRYFKATAAAANKPGNSSSSGNTTTTTTELEDYWESARILAVAHGKVNAMTIHGDSSSSSSSNSSDERVETSLPNDYYDTLPIVHACVLSRREIPLSLMERALRRYRHQLLSPDHFMVGNLPLHLAAALPPPPSPALLQLPAGSDDENDPNENDNDNDDDDDDDELAFHEIDILDEIFRAGPAAAASVPNRAGKTPFHVAVERGTRRWNTGCRLLLEAYPTALLLLRQRDEDQQQQEQQQHHQQQPEPSTAHSKVSIHVSPIQYKMIVSEVVARYNCLTLAYTLIQMNPGVIL